MVTVEVEVSNVLFYTFTPIFYSLCGASIPFFLLRKHFARLRALKESTDRIGLVVERVFEMCGAVGGGVFALLICKYYYGDYSLISPILLSSFIFLLYFIGAKIR